MTTTFATDPALFIFTSLTAGSSHIVTATSRLETILRANRVPFKAVDIATDDKARMLWGRRAGKDAQGRVRKLPALIQEGFVLGDLVEIEEWNEYGELKQHVKIYYDEFTIPSINNKPPESKLRPRKQFNANPTPPAAVAAVAVGASAAAAAAASKSIPTPPPLPQPGMSTKDSSPTITEPSAGSGPPPKGKSSVLPMRSVADEAAQRAKEIRLKSLREKVHGKDGSKNATEEGMKAIVTETSTPDGKGDEAKAGNIDKKKAAEDDDEDEDSDEDSDDDDEDETKSQVKKPSFSIAQVEPASKEEVKKVEEDNKIQEQPILEKALEKKDATQSTTKRKEGEEEDDDTDDSDEEEEEEEKEEKEEKKEEKEEEDSDDDDDSDEDSDDYEDARAEVEPPAKK